MTSPLVAEAQTFENYVLSIGTYEHWYYTDEDSDGSVIVYDGKAWTFGAYPFRDGSRLTVTAHRPGDTSCREVDSMFLVDAPEPVIAAVLRHSREFTESYRRAVAQWSRMAKEQRERDERNAREKAESDRRRAELAAMTNEQLLELWIERGRALIAKDRARLTCAVGLAEALAR